MKSFFIVLCVILALSSAAPGSDEATMKKMHDSHEECRKQYGLEEVGSDKILNVNAPEETLAKYSYCFGKKFGYIGEDNKIDREIAKQQFEAMIPGSTEEFMKACIPDGEVTEKVALEINRCIKHKYAELHKH